MNCLTIITAIGSIVLVIVTFLYLLETKKMRDISSLALKIDSSPMVFIHKIHTQQTLDEPKKKLIIQENFIIKNTGKMEARNINIKYKILIGKQVQVPGELKDFPYIFPTQEIAFDSVPVFIELNNEEIQISKGQIQNGKAIFFRPETKPKLEMEIEIYYQGFKDEPQRIPYLCQYHWDSAKWGMMVLSKKEEASNERQ